MCSSQISLLWWPFVMACEVMIHVLLCLISPSLFFFLHLPPSFPSPSLPLPPSLSLALPPSQPFASGTCMSSVVNPVSGVPLAGNPHISTSSQTQQPRPQAPGVCVCVCVCVALIHSSCLPCTLYMQAQATLNTVGQAVRPPSRLRHYHKTPPTSHTHRLTR